MRLHQFQKSKQILHMMRMQTCKVLLKTKDKHVKVNLWHIKYLCTETLPSIT